MSIQTSLGCVKEIGQWRCWNSARITAGERWGAVRCAKTLYAAKSYLADLLSRIYTRRLHTSFTSNTYSLISSCSLATASGDCVHQQVNHNFEYKYLLLLLSGFLEYSSTAVHNLRFEYCMPIGPIAIRSGTAQKSEKVQNVSSKMTPPLSI